MNYIEYVDLMATFPININNTYNSELILIKNKKYQKRNATLIKQ